MNLILDFDSTFIQVETLDIWAAITRPEALKEIEKITEQGVIGEISFTESLQKRIQLLKAHKDELPAVIDYLAQKITPSFMRHKAFLQQYSKDIYIVSGGFKEFIEPIVKPFGLSQVFANTFVYDDKGSILDFDRDNVLSRGDGKVLCVKKLGLKGPVYAIGDGYSDYLLREMGVADKFFAFTENIIRPSILDKADYVITSFDEFYENILSKK